MTTEAFLRHHWSIFKPTCEIKFATTGNEAGAIGAAYSAYLKVNWACVNLLLRGGTLFETIKFSPTINLF